MAWSERLPSGRYRGIYRDRNGHRHTLAQTYTQRAEAKREAGLVEQQARNSPQWRQRAQRQTWGDWCDQWWPTRQVEGGTARGDTSRLNTHVRPYWDNEPLADIDPTQVGNWVRALQGTTATVSTRKGQGVEHAGSQTRTGTGRALSASTVHKAFRLFSASMRAAVHHGLIDVNPCNGTELPTQEPSDETFLTRDEYDRLRAAAPDELTAVLLDVAVGTGMRWGEIVGLHRHRVDLDQQVITVQEVFEQGTGQIKPYPKRASKRGVPLTDELAATLDGWLRAQPVTPCATPHRGKTCDGSLVFPTANGTVQLYSNFRRSRFNQAAREAGLTLTPHDLRHTYASWLLQRGVSIEAVSALLGHANITTTQRYAHLADTQWDTVRGVLTTTDVPHGDEAATSAPRLPHDNDTKEGGTVVHLDRWRRSTG